jgi:GntR family transcriptional regulator
MITLSSLSKVPIYQQIIDQILSQIAMGILEAHVQMPAVRSLAQNLGINPNTVVKAYSELEHAGYLYTKAGVGSFVSEEASFNSKLKQQKLDELRKEIALLHKLGYQQDTLISMIHEIYQEDQQ